MQEYLRLVSPFQNSNILVIGDLRVTVSAKHPMGETVGTGLFPPVIPLDRRPDIL